MQNTPQITLDSAFPMNVERALSIVAARRNGISELSNNARLLVAELLRVVCAADPRKSVRVSTSVLSDALAMSARTIHRIKSELEEAGWITRHQIQSRRLGMQISDVTFTDKALVTLELINSKSVKRPKKAQYVFPEELRFLEKLNLKPWAIFSLIKIARMHKARLGDVVSCIKARLDGIQNVYGYIKSVIVNGGDRDWASYRNDCQAAQTKRAKQAQEAALKAEELNAAQQQANAEIARFDAELRANMWVKTEALEALKALFQVGQVLVTTAGKKERFKREGDSFYHDKNAINSWAPIAHVGRLTYLVKTGQLKTDE